MMAKPGRPARRKSAVPSARGGSRDQAQPAGWTFLSNHAHVLICLHHEPDLTLREVANRVGVTERSVQRILSELEEAGYVRRERTGLRNRYRFRTHIPLRHPVEQHCTVGDLIDMVRKKNRS